MTIVRHYIAHIKYIILENTLNEMKLESNQSSTFPETHWKPYIYIVSKQKYI